MDCCHQKHVLNTCLLRAVCESCRTSPSPGSCSRELTAPNRDVPFPSFTAWMFTELGIWRQNSVPAFPELTVYPYEIEGALETGNWWWTSVWLWCARRGRVIRWLVEGALRSFGKKELLALNNQERLGGRGSLKIVLAWQVPQIPRKEKCKGLRWREELSW